MNGPLRIQSSDASCARNSPGHERHSLPQPAPPDSALLPLTDSALLASEADACPLGSRLSSEVLLPSFRLSPLWAAGPLRLSCDAQPARGHGCSPLLRPEDSSSNATNLCDLTGGPGSTRHCVAPRELRKPQPGGRGRGGQDTPFPLPACLPPMAPMASSRNLALSAGASPTPVPPQRHVPRFLEHGGRTAARNLSTRMTDENTSVRYFPKMTSLHESASSSGHAGRLGEDGPVGHCRSERLQDREAEGNADDLDPQRTDVL